MVYIDEIDASCPTRQSGHTTCIDAEVLGQLLQELDGIKTSDERPVFVFAGTNRKDMIDPAILQRFTEHIEIALPGWMNAFNCSNSSSKYRSKRQRASCK